MSVCDIPKLEKLTRRYWRHECPPLDWYIVKLLPDEMACAEERNALPVLEEPCDLLVLLVGHSIEPLLQSAWAYKPKRVLLVLNQRYGRNWSGEEQKRKLQELLAQLPNPPAVEEPAAIIQASPVNVFQALLQRVRQTDQVIVDITGAKKNMVVGAFLFAAFADVPVSYVDFDEGAYDPEKRRPYGYGCRIGLLDNPYSAFALRDWERVRSLYRRYNFREARRVLEQLIQAMSDKMGQESGLFTLFQIESVRKLDQILHCYALWDAGDFLRAQEVAGTIDDFDPPKSVNALGDIWWNVPQEGQLTDSVSGLLAWSEEVVAQDRKRSFFTQPDKVWIYAYDELARAKRLLKFHENARSAYLRAAGLNEVLLRARLSLLRNRGLKIAPKSTSDKKWRQILERAGVRKVFRLLAWGSALEQDGIRLELPDSVKKLDPFWQNTAFSGSNWNQLFSVRNKLAHTFLSIPDDLAQAAIEFVEANITEFKKNRWYRLAGMRGGLSAVEEEDVQSLTWKELCALCKLDFLPPNLCPTVSEKE